MSKGTDNVTSPRRAARGFSMIELMVALLIAILLALGIVQIFGASRTTYQAQEGLARVQESGRYATQYMQRQLRMIGYMGCGADTERVSQLSFVNHFATYSATLPGGDVVDPTLRFQRPIEGFPASAIPTAIQTAIGTGVAVLPNTDVLVVRVLGDETVPVLSVALSTDSITLSTTIADATAAAVAQAGAGVAAPYGLQTCRSVDTFGGTLTATTVAAVGIPGPPNVYKDPTVTTCGAGGCPWDFRISNAFLNAPAGTAGLQLNGELHRAEFYVFYVANDSSTPPIPNLYMKRFNRTNTAAGKTAFQVEDNPESLAEGVELLNFSYGVDTDGDGQLNAYRTAAQVAAADTTGGTTAGLDAVWRQVVSVRVGMLIRGPSYGAATGSHNYTVLGTTVTKTDGFMRQVYETTIALRNRIFNS